jgi:hypothetical protein
MIPLTLFKLPQIYVILKIKTSKGLQKFFGEILQKFTTLFVVCY